MKKRSLKLLSMVLVLVMLLGMLTGCGGNDNGDKDSGSNGGDGGAAYDALNIMFVVTGNLGGAAKRGRLLGGRSGRFDDHLRCPLG